MRIGIDIGGSHIGVGLVDENGNIIIKREKDLLKKESLNLETTITNTIIEYINEIMIEESLNINQIKFIGIAYPASLRNGKIGKSTNLNFLEGENIKESIKKNFNIPVYIKNDAKCAAICEKKYGSLKEYSNCVFLTIGTGIGGAAFINYTLLSTTQNDLFKIGHITIQKDGIECKCGKRGCFEQYASITALKREVKDKYNINEELTGISLYEFIIQNIQDEKMKKIVNEYVENICIGLSNIVKLFEPEAISIGGSFAYYENIFLEALEKKLKENQMLSGDNCPKILIATYKNDAGIIGAANIV